MRKNLVREKNMLHILWIVMILGGLVYGMLTGNAAAVGEGALSSAKEAVSLAIAMAGAVALWTGLMEVAKDCGIMERLTKLMRRPVRWLFPDVPAGHPAEEAIVSNLLANLLGLGWAATPAGLRAMRELRMLQLKQAGLSEEPELPAGALASASPDMCTLLILNISSLQLIPVNVIAYRSQYGSAEPTAILGIALFVTTCSTVVGILYAAFRRKHAKDK